MFDRFRGTIRRMFCGAARVEAVAIPVLIEPEHVTHPDDVPMYPNLSAHPERQSLNTDPGFRSVLMKQLETHEKLLRELIELERKG